MVGDIADEVARQRGDGDVEQKADRQVVGLEVDTDHRAEFEIDEQQQDVIDAGRALGEHLEEGRYRGDGNRAADGEQAEIVEAFDQEVADRVGLLVHALPMLV